MIELVSIKKDVIVYQGLDSFFIIVNKKGTFESEVVSNITFFYDEQYFFTKKPSTLFLKNFFKMLSLMNSLEGDVNEIYDLIRSPYTKKVFSEKYKLLKKPQNEFFITGDELEDIMPRYKYHILIKDTFEFMIDDESVIAYEVNGQHVLDLNSFFYEDNGYYYKVNDVCELKECTEEDYSLVSVKGKKTNFFKYELKKNIDLSKYKKFKKIKINQKFQCVVLDKLHFISDFKEYKIYHPDMLIYVL